ncbi:NUDIX domain-containing protein [Candidatus Saccharibacteria bacterium]|nr:MAG: NUDIX domain-containing protein [Candidatus Saccharibacteria bacterium]
MSEHDIDIVDDNDVVIGRASKSEAQQEGLRHRIVRVVLEDPSGMILIQKRQANKELYPGCWDNSASGHVVCGEDYQVAAERELYEELGVVAKLEQVQYYPSYREAGWYKLNRFNTLYRSVILAETTLKLQVDEVADVRWISALELRDLVENHTTEVADGLIEVYEIMYKP